MKTDENLFYGKVVSFGTVSGDTLAIKNPIPVFQFERLFFVGVIPRNATTNDWAIEKKSAIAWDAVTDYIIFDSEEQYAELIDKSMK
jgi:hypothetical protein